ncbi:uncharacterized protein MONBRDRAFT_18904 [Monosiga brevicollis MX1]|uniref:Probable serine incorporator n=1 Tax=Monosiga brevicollis TaxID=81824 RepID=SERIC_MONBE|nr:uncharacterized protein MONBRDRAFT_18904 [Monosiga brevicollis MX1]A9UY97.1 RecName: Full=Probable serine incorporator [Monosiga brevicollis]EDQ89821.1 predicted protein [Monosiga brevicollis MX1]|eukprot:XP_001745243.1 hypothetical protein [Monosiga brevicollis MX1]
MGLVASCFGGLAAYAAESVACCCGSAACSLCCRSCPSCTNSTSTRITYAILFFLSSIAAWIMLDKDVSKGLMKVCCYHSTLFRLVLFTQPAIKTTTNVVPWGELGVMRIMFSVCLFHLFLSLCTIGVSSSKDPRSSLHNGMWFIKLILLVGAMVGSFFISNSFFIGASWSWIGLVGAVLFMIVQFILLVDFAYSWNDSWVGKLEEGSKCAGFGSYRLISATVMLMAFVITLTVLMFHFYTNGDCKLSNFFIGFNLALALLVTLTSMLPSVREALPSSGILQSSVVAAYATYLVWSAVSGVPSTCHPLIAVAPLFLSSRGFLPPLPYVALKPAECGGDAGTNTAAIVIGALLTFISVAYSSIRTSSKSQLGKLGLQQGSNENIYLMDDKAADFDEDDEDRRLQRVVDNEQDAVRYSWSFFHLTFAVAALYLMMVLTEWDSSDADVRIGKGWASVWVQVVSSWVIFLLYGWTMMAPVCLPDRDFS